MGRLSGHQAQVMALAVDTDFSQEGHDLVISGSKDHYIKVSTLNMHMQIIIKVSRQDDWKEHVEGFVWNQPVFCSFAML